MYSLELQKIYFPLVFNMQKKKKRLLIKLSPCNFSTSRFVLPMALWKLQILRFFSKIGIFRSFEVEHFDIPGTVIRRNFRFWA